MSLSFLFKIVYKAKLVYKFRCSQKKAHNRGSMNSRFFFVTKLKCHKFQLLKITLFYTLIFAQTPMVYAENENLNPPSFSCRKLFQAKTIQTLSLADKSKVVDFQKKLKPIEENLSEIKTKALDSFGLELFLKQLKADYDFLEHSRMIIWDQQIIKDGQQSVWRFFTELQRINSNLSFIDLGLKSTKLSTSISSLASQLELTRASYFKLMHSLDESCFHNTINELNYTELPPINTKILNAPPIQIIETLRQSIFNAHNTITGQHLLRAQDLMFAEKIRSDYQSDHSYRVVKSMLDLLTSLNFKLNQTRKLLDFKKEDMEPIDNYLKEWNYFLNSTSVQTALEMESLQYGIQRATQAEALRSEIQKFKLYYNWFKSSGNVLKLTN